jgi:serine/threonine-protein kinase
MSSCEARPSSRLSHPNIVEVYDAGVEGRLRYIVMQYVPGGTLRDVIRQHAPLDPRRAVSLTLKLAEALDYGHTRGIVHCDVKPGNVLLGDQGEPKIADFGIAQSLTQSGGSDLIAGTAAYVSPEQAQGGHVDGRSDVYSLAAVLYEMLGGRRPTTRIGRTRPPRDGGNTSHCSRTIRSCHRSSRDRDARPGG